MPRYNPNGGFYWRDQPCIKCGGHEFSVLRRTVCRYCDNERAKARFVEKHDAFMATERIYRRELYKNDPQYRAADRARKRTRNWYWRKDDRIIKTTVTHLLIGCLPSAFRARIQSLWLPGMSDDNYGAEHGQWCFDHIEPLDSFDLLDQDQLRTAMNFINVRPLWSEANCGKDNYHGEVRSDDGAHPGYCSTLGDVRGDAGRPHQEDPGDRAAGAGQCSEAGDQTGAGEALAWTEDRPTRERAAA